MFAFHFDLVYVDLIPECYVNAIQDKVIAIYLNFSDWE